jgi:uncharacterized protein YyaL (SSP411 family)
MISPSPFRFSPRANRAHLIRWREWGAEAFEEAAREHKLIALFITAFWCGVCQRQDETALSADEVQLLLNAYFVPIRVEESRRPDVDMRYTRDGWPTLAFLSPDAQPILTVNSLETETLTRVLVQLVDLQEREGERLGAGVEVDGGERQAQAPDVSRLRRSAVDEVLETLVGLEDRTQGGFGGPDKYFYTDALLWYLELENPRFLEHLRLTLDTLRRRSIYDAVGGGFFRYSSQPDWNEPHREKLLADQANLLRVALLAHERTRSAEYRELAEQLLTYLDGTLGAVRPPYFAGCQDYVRTPDGSGWTSVIDEVLYCDANALAASAYLEAARVLGRQDSLERAIRLTDALWGAFRAPDGGLFHYLDASGVHAPGLLADSVALGNTLLDAFDASGEDRYSIQAAQLGHDILRLHLNPGGGFFDISQPGPAALRRPLTVLTQNAAAAMFFLRLAEARVDPRLRDAAQWALLAYRGDASIYGAYAASFGHALDWYLSSEP